MIQVSPLLSTLWKRYHITEDDEMKRMGVLHGELSRVIAELGHGETLVIADYGLPIPPEVKMIDLAVAPGVPGFQQVLDAVLAELEVEGFIAAVELKQSNPALLASIRERTGKSGELVSHETLKKLVGTSRAVVRTGEWTPYANVILQAGVVF